MNYEYLILDLAITLFAYLIVPYIKFIILKKSGTKKNIKNFILLNSIVVAILFMLVRAFVLNDKNPVRTFAPAILYYYLNYLIYIVWLKIDKTLNKTKRKNSQKISNEQKAIIVGMIGTIIFAGLSVYQILDKNKQEKSFIEFKETSLNECYDSVQEKYDEIFDTFKVCSPNENIGELCSYETQDIRSKIEELERNDMTNCRKWFLN